jgi:hypothetical protein
MKQCRASHRLWTYLLFALIFFAGGSARAGTCSNPTGNEGAYIYNTDYHVMQFCNGTTWMSMGSSGTGTGMTLISTQTASASASLQFTNLPTSYNTLWLNCSGMEPGTATVALQLQVGEGATPTWETASYNYGDTLSSSVSGGSNTNATAASAIQLDQGLDGTSTSYSASYEILINNVSNTTFYKSILYQSAAYVATNGGYYNNNGAGVYTGDTNAITAVRVQYSSGNISVGKCSLYGMN